MPVHVRRLAYNDGEALAALIARARERDELRAFSPWIERGVGADIEGPSRAAVAVDETGLVGFVIPDLKALVVEPARRMRGIGGRLVDAGLAIEREHGNPALYLGAVPGDARGEAFLRATGFVAHSTVHDMELAPSIVVPSPPVPAGYAARPFDRTRDAETWPDAFNEAFAAHPTPLRLDPLDLRRWLGEPGFRDDDTILLEDSAGEIAGFVSTDPRYRPDGSLIGRAELWAIGVAPAHRGRGLGRALLAIGIGWLRALGVETVTLSVSARNPTALALYQRAGFVRTAQRDRWARPVEA
ncbi:MAG TPA: GNAT family N-acetyltransferase [Candidatus Limnocylindrales bacterium]